MSDDRALLQAPPARGACFIAGPFMVDSSSIGLYLSFAMKSSLPILFLLAALSQTAGAGDAKNLLPEQFGVQHLMEYLNLQPGDITFRSDYTEPDSFRLKVVADLMREPLKTVDYAASIRSADVIGQPEVVAGMLFDDLKTEYQTARSRSYQPTADEMQRRYDLYYSNYNLNELLSRAANYLDVIIPKSTEKGLARLTAKQRAFLSNEFKELLISRVEEESFSLEQLDSVDKVEQAYADTFVTFGGRIDKDPIISAGIDFLRDILPLVKNFRKYVAAAPGGAEKLLSKGAYLPSEITKSNYLGKQKGWAVGGPGRDYYSGDYWFILDIGGDDVYDLSYDPANPHPVIIIDLGGDDLYRSKTDFTLGSGCFSTGILLDFGGGDDVYKGKSFCLGSGYFGFGLLYDDGGDDRYSGDTHVEAAGSFGIGLLIDESGRDIYDAALNSQGFGFVEGAGVLYDRRGTDSYYAGGKYKDILRYEDHYLSMSQGFATGMRPQMSGGIGALIDLQGDDRYSSDIFAQGVGYWWSLGILYDSSGSDNYQSFQYAQGTATHMALGILVDDFGNDVYYGKGLMQGCGHDYACGIMLDRHGNDTYTAFDLSQGAGSANGAGLLIDCDGDDRYFISNRANTHGYGNPRRDFGSIGLFIDLGGKDEYTGSGHDNYYWQTNSQWGGGMDIQYIPPDTARKE